MILQWNLVDYEVPESEPPQSRDLELLHPIFRGPLERYLAFAQPYCPHELRFGECRRTLERQIWLLAQGRINAERVRSWTLESRHRVGMACDLIMINRETGAAVWDGPTWVALYAAAPPGWFGLKTISKELVHLELAVADEVIARGNEFGVVLT